MTPHFELSRADEWSNELDKSLLREAFVPRPHLGDVKSQGAPTGSLLLKILAHRPSKTLCLVVVPLNTFTPLYEGLSFRTLQRRFRSSPPLDTAAQTQNADDEDSLFDLLADRVGQAVRGGTSDSWLECEMGRGEASITLHSACNDRRFSISFDLSSLDRDEGPAFIRHHLLEPLAQLALQSTGQHNRNGDETGGSSLMSLLSDAGASRRLLIAGAALQGLSVLHEGPTSSNDGDSIRTSPPTEPTVEAAEKPRSKVQAHSPSPPRTPSPLASADHTADPGSSALNDNGEDMILLLRPTQTPKKTKAEEQGAAKDEATSRSSLPLSPSPSLSNPKPRAKSHEGQNSSSISTSATTTGRDGKTSRKKDDDDERSGRSSSGSSSSSATNHAHDDDDDEYASAPSKKRGEKRHRGSSSSSSPAASGTAPGKSTSPSPGAARMKDQEIESKGKDGFQEQEEEQEAVQSRQDSLPPASISAPADAHAPARSTSTVSTRGSRGSSTYTRGLAKKKRL